MHIVVFITVPSGRKAGEIAKFLLARKLAACVNIIPKVDSLFWWHKKINKAKEILLMAKTHKKLFAKLVKAVKSKHPYEVPEIIALPIILGNREYLEWIDESCR